MIKEMNLHYSFTTPASVHDEEALTALELAGRQGKKINEIIVDQNNLRTTTENKLREQDGDIAAKFGAQDRTIETRLNSQDHKLEEFEDFVIPSEVRTGIKENINDGTFDSAINNYLGDLETRLDNIVASSGSDNTEIVDARVDAKGITWSTVGNSIRYGQQTVTGSNVYWGYKLKIPQGSKGGFLSLDPYNLFLGGSKFFVKCGKSTDTEGIHDITVFGQVDISQGEYETLKVFNGGKGCAIIELPKDYARIRIYANLNTEATAEREIEINCTTMENTLASSFAEYLINSPSELIDNTINMGTTTTGAGSDVYGAYSEGDKILVTLGAYNVNEFECLEIYGFYNAIEGGDAGEYKKLDTLTATGETHSIALTESYNMIRFYAKVKSESAGGVVDYSYIIIPGSSIMGTVINSTDGKIADRLEPLAPLSCECNSYDILVLGDSYSAQGLYLNEMKARLEKVKPVNITNLGVGSMTIKGEASENTLAKQVTQLETEVSAGNITAPNIVIIEGGHNDTFDATTNYRESFVKSKEGYTKTINASDLSVTTLGEWVGGLDGKDVRNLDTDAVFYTYYKNMVSTKPIGDSYDIRYDKFMWFYNSTELIKVYFSATDTPETVALAAEWASDWTSCDWKPSITSGKLYVETYKLENYIVQKGMTREILNADDSTTSIIFKGEGTNGLGYETIYTNVPITMFDVQQYPTMLENHTLAVSLEEITLDNFAGAYRNACERIHKLFPNAQIFITSVSPLGYWDGVNNLVTRRSKQRDQQRECASLCGANFIDWYGESNISTITTRGATGTIEDPFNSKNTYDKNCVLKGDSNDGMHPNQRGARKLGRLTANAILTRFIDVEGE